MKKLLFLLCFTLPFLLSAEDSFAQIFRKPKYRELTEKDLVAEVVKCMRTKDFLSYCDMFPPTDSMIYWVMRSAPHTSKDYQVMKDLLIHPVKAVRNDSIMTAYFAKQFDSIMRRGVQLGVNWDGILLSRYELKKSKETRNTTLEKISPNRYNGFFFIHDLLSLKTYGFAITDIMQINGNWYGGQLDNIFIAKSSDEYMHKKQLEQFRIKQGKPGNFGEDTTFNIIDTTTDPVNYRKVVVDRKMFKGLFDKEYEVTLYVRYLRGLCPGGICSWDAVFQFRDEEPIVAEVTKTPDGKWHFAEEWGVLDLVSTPDGFMGSWTSSADQTSYDAVFHEAPLIPRKTRKMDVMLDEYEQ